MSKCTICKECKYPNSKTLYLEDKDGIPYCNSEGLLSDKSREILARKPNELKSVHAPQTGPYA
jgi:hypothetical protein